ncbi:hypothetical protein AGMMS49975_03940 [Clostridia bacterium]|nr:hypothetical protein AGMMS49975_03940 [Clostridia bacterium]GHU76845.1 hypothetical protein FACS1894188_10000 [Clostridia bacterium]
MDIKKNKTPNYLKKLLSLLSMCSRAGKLTSGEAHTLAVIRDRSAKLLIISADASANTVKKFSDKATFYKIEFLKLRAGRKRQIGPAVGPTPRSLVAIMDENFAEMIKKEIKKSQNIEVRDVDEMKALQNASIRENYMKKYGTEYPEEYQ